ncbi:MAG: bifunctional (p)ppGpp synthetase/guanosine-3',5'-bis(diphosphate) 3'-pyrophosphohydrolase [Deltaproteobacteria bacterium]|nr:bifunctional (p)ppGpp synthetase/guanosine-3',5'-bis(diphosphate) 3'-pyrophosphohydrolase [Deltaproteobacteria bacterium]
MHRIEDILDQIIANNPDADSEIVERAYIFAAKAHQGQTRRNGEPYLSHPLAVAWILAVDMKLDVTAVTAGMLHDTVEDTATTIDDITELFNQDVALIVDGVTKISMMPVSSSAERQAEYIRKMIMAMSSDIRVILVKLADRLHNMRTLGFMPAHKQTQIAQETIDIYAPLASRLGMHKVQTELEDLCLFYLQPEVYQEIRDGIARKRGEREAYIKETIKFIAAKMKEFGINCELSGRSKHIYGIYKKMVKQNLALNQVYDVTAFRLIVDAVQECYAALGFIHSIFKPIPGRFKDYVNLPKANGYQSLHTAVIGPRAERIEVQIRTRDMHAFAENGIAAHWKYKDGIPLSEKEYQRFAWMRSLLEWQKELKDPNEFLASVREGLTQEEVYVFTPAGDVRELPSGSTPLDFAYTIHTEVGHRCIGAKINGVIVPLRYVLHNGDTVEILTSKNGTPSKDWLSFIVTPKARYRVRQWFKASERERALSLGKEMLEKEFRKAHINFNQALKDGELDKIAQDMSLAGVDDLIASVAFGRFSAGHVLSKLKPQPETRPSLVSRVVQAVTRKTKEGIKVRGIGDVLVRFAGCCNPLPGEDIVGYVTLGRGVTVHSARCQNLLIADPQRRVDVEWESTEGQTYPVRIQVLAQDRPGVLAEMSGAISEAKANIIQASVDVTPDKKAQNEFTIQVSSKEHLRQVMSNLRKVKNVERINRIGQHNIT